MRSHSAIFASSFTPASLPGLVADLSVANARTPAGTDYAAEFAGTGEFLSASSAALAYDPVKGYTVCFWLHNAGWGGAPAVVSAGPLSVDMNATRLLVARSGGGSSASVNAGTSPAIGEWMFIAATIDSPGGSAKIRVDRYPSVSVALAGTPDVGAVVKINNVAGVNVPMRVGSLLVAQQVLTDAEIDEVFGTPGGASYAGLTPSLRAKVAEFWEFSESSGNRVGSKSSIALVPTGTVTRTTGPATAAPASTGDPIQWWVSGSGGRSDPIALGSARPTYVAAAASLTGRPALRFADSPTVAMTALASLGLQSHTLVTVGRSLYRNGFHNYVTLGSVSGGVYSILRDFYVGRPDAYTTGGADLLLSGDSSRTRYADIRVLLSDSTDFRLRANGYETVGSARSSATASGLVVGGGESFYGAAEDFERVLVFARRLTSDEITRLEEHLRQQYPRPMPSSTQPVVLWTGNSIHYGVGASDVAHDIPTVAMGTLGLTYGSRWLDFSLNGLSSMECIADDPGRVTPYRNDARLTVVCWTEITNDIYLYGNNAATAYQHAKDYVAVIKAALPGCKIVLTTCLPRAGSYVTRNTVNASLRTDFPTATPYSHVFSPTAAWATDCVLADWAAEPTMGPDGAELNATYYDGIQIHPTSAGAALLAAISANALTVAGVT